MAFLPDEARKEIDGKAVPQRSTGQVVSAKFGADALESFTSVGVLRIVGQSATVIRTRAAVIEVVLKLSLVPINFTQTTYSCGMVNCVCGLGH